MKVDYDAKPASRPKIVDLGRFIDHKRKIIRSNTGQIRFDYGQGVCTIDAPARVGASGFLKKHGPVERSSVTIDSQNEYATVLVVSLDGEAAFAQPERAGAGRHAGPADGLGRARGDFQGRRRQADVSWQAGCQHRHHAVGGRRDSRPADVKNPTLSKATPLDPNGNARGHSLDALRRVQRRDASRAAA